MTQIPFSLKVKLFDIKGAKTFLLCNNIENNKKTFHFPVSFLLLF
jgi:hypothetical protein